MTRAVSGKAALLTLWSVVMLLGVTLADDTDQRGKYAKVREARRLTRTAVASIDAGTYDSAIFRLDSVLVGDSSNAEAWYFRSLSQAKSGDTTAALESLGQGVVRAPLSTRIKLLLARLKLAIGEPAAAGTILNQILAIKPNEGEAHYLKGRAQLQQSDTTAALESFASALKTVYPSTEDE